MPSRDRARATGRAEEYISFAGIPRDVMRTKKYASLSGWAVKLLLELAYQYRGDGRRNNNGDLQATYSILKGQGWNSPGTLAKAIQELLDVGFIIKTQQGGKHKPNLFAVTWKPIGECLDKRGRPKLLDHPPTRTAPGTWKDE